MTYLTKSRFQLGNQCLTKIYYDTFKDKYANTNSDNDFLKALASGGFQVGEIAKLYYENGISIEGNTEEAIAATNQYIKDGAKTLFEAALKFNHQLIRVDILDFTPNHIRLIEVKSKSCDGDNPEQFVNKDGTISSSWKKYVEDLTFQYTVAKNYFRSIGDDRPITPYLLMTDKRKTTSINGLHSLFEIRTKNNRKYCQKLPGINKKSVGDSILIEIEASSLVKIVLNDSASYTNTLLGTNSFEELISVLEQQCKAYEAGQAPVYNKLSLTCKDCEFKRNESDPTSLKSGFNECFYHHKKWTNEEIQLPKSWDIWNTRSKKKMLAENRWFLSEVQIEDIETKNELWTEPTMGAPLTATQRKWIQVENTLKQPPLPYFDKIGFEDFKDKDVNYPLHFIDFETSAPAVPFYKGYRPFQGLTFQFSHHKMQKDGSYEHSTEFIGDGKAGDPTFEFIEHFYKALSNDKGTIFRYSIHENTYVNYAIEQLEIRSPFSNQQTKTYIDFLKSITYKKEGKNEVRKGDRCMMDLLEIVKNYYWHPLMKGSNSIKAVLPAIINHSSYLQEKYEQPIYGDGIKSLNFNNKIWIEKGEKNHFKDPYKLLPTLNDIFGIDLTTIDELFEDETIGNGGAAMTAWAYTQFSSMSKQERDRIFKALKMYCELDTLAMVMIWEGFTNFNHQ